MREQGTKLNYSVPCSFNFSAGYNTQRDSAIMAAVFPRCI